MTAAATRRRGPLRLAVGLLLGAILLTAFPQPASAHAVLVSSSPANGSRVAASPDAVRLTFDERIGLVPGAGVVLSSDGGRVGRGAGRLSADGRSLLLPLRPDLPRGVYTVTWRAVSADTHVVSGSIRFGVRQSATAVVPTTPPWTELDTAAAAVQGTAYLGTVLSIGVPGTVLLLWPSLRRRRAVGVLAATGGVALVAGALADLLLRGPRAAGSGWAGVLRLDGLGSVLQSGVGAVLLVRVAIVVAAAIMLVALRRGSPGALRILLGATAIGVLPTIALLGHASASASATWLIPTTVVHLGAMDLWLGGLVVLVVVLVPRLRASPLARRAAPTARILGSWSRVAFAAVAALILTGELQALSSVSPLRSLWTTDYGVLLLVKLLLLGAALAAAIGSHRIAGIAAGRRSGVGVLGRVVAIETVAVVAVVAVTAVLTMKPPAAQSYGPAVTAAVPLGPDRVDLTVDSTRRGPMSLHLVVRDGRGRPQQAQAVTGTLTTEGIGALDVTFRRDAGGRWISTDAQAPITGRWVLVLHVTLNEEYAYATSAAWTVW